MSAHWLNEERLRVYPRIMSFGRDLVTLGRAWRLVLGDGTRIARQAFDSGALPSVRMPSMFAQLRLLGVSVDAAYALHSIVAGLAVAAVGLAWRSAAPDALKNAALMCGILLVTPCLFDYDLAWLAFRQAWMEGLRRGECNTLILPCLLWIIARRALRATV